MARAAIALLLLPLCAACSFALKGGIHRFSDSAIEDLRDSASIESIELEAELGRYLEGRVDLGLSMGTVESWSGTEFWDFRLTSRYNMRRDQLVSPYVGGGVGFFRWHTRRVVFIEPPFCFPSPSDDCEATDDETLADGTFPHAVAGTRIRVSKRVDALVETRFDFSKDDGEFDFDSNQLLFGFRFEMQ